ncbi:MAG TPA: M23 family metallopeptidase [Thioalkalivibrio sp.]|nr:M23 family metallopeptidase [Thioalkalivibrio sp.]
MRTLILLIGFLLTPSLFAETLPRHAPVPGGVALVEFRAAADVEPLARYQDRPVLVLAHEGGYTAVVGLPLDAAIGTHDLEVAWGGNGRSTIPFEVTSKEYATQHLTIKDQSKVDLSQADLERHWREQAVVRDVLKTRSEPLPALDFLQPVPGPYANTYGKRRIINGQPRNPHRGMDIPAAQGTPIRAPADGVVLHTGDFFFSGNVVYLDHGQGVLTLYAHLARIDVEPGQRVVRGETIGTVGASGRVTGPHLHWSVYLNRNAVDPELFLPETTAAP